VPRRRRLWSDGGRVVTGRCPLCRPRLSVTPLLLAMIHDVLRHWVRAAGRPLLRVLSTQQEHALAWRVDVVRRSERLRQAISHHHFLLEVATFRVAAA